MTLFGWIVLLSLSVLGIYFAIQLISDIFWNLKLYKYHNHIGVKTPKVPRIYWIKRSYGLILTSLFVITTLFSGAFAPPNMLGERRLVNAIPVNSQSKIQALLSQNQNSWFSDFFRMAENDFAVDAPEAIGDQGAAERDYIGTNVQVDGVDEGDIVKTDGYDIYYATRYQNRVRVFNIALNGDILPQADIDLGDLYAESIYITETQLIVIGYIYSFMPSYYPEAMDYIGWPYASYTGSVQIYNRETLDIEYTLETDANFYQHRLIDQSLFLVSNKQLYNTDDYRPMFKETKNDTTETTRLSYSDIYYFEDIPISSMTVVTGIKLDTYEVNSQAFLGSVSQIYATKDTLYTAYNYYGYEFNEYKGYVQIIKYNLDSETGTVTYVGQKQLSGFIHDQYWMDEHQGYFRVVTSAWNPIKNELHILEEDPNTDELKIVGSITNGLGKVNETVKSVRFNEDLAYVVTFEQTDPLYTIDLSNPENPVILSAIEEPGYSTYLHVWGQNDRLIGFGFSADETGRVTGLKISAYDTALTEPLDTYQLNDQDDDGIYSYSYSEASYNPKAMLVSPEKNIIAFPVMSWRYYTLETDQGWSFSYLSHYLIFYINFDAEDPNDVISDPIVVSHEETGYYNSIDRGVYIDNMIYTLSFNQIVSFDLSTMSIRESIIFDTYFDDKE
ncbi:beta-propeller domain-containing protein [Peloplasma aerotolerans]|uniref:Beta-propeller domain-containing protein n=1 Tax=Peloplasma aerotolerans TaxID=3044389 RepID=A0AAW6U4V7_9MOLU|nr:beta-propeller domain-containing protein [Mariniplasma sp. M4Ah]MDI6453008.1 beta-propeller domain-containing protein [Mariniplasma sp. M4Ah]